MKQDSPSSCPSLFLRRCLSRRWLITDSVPVSLSRPSRLLAAFGLLENKQEERVESSLFFFLIKAVVVMSMLVQKPENYYADQLQSCCSTASSLRLLCSPQNYLRVKRQFNINDLICTQHYLHKQYHHAIEKAATRLLYETSIGKKAHRWAKKRDHFSMQQDDN